MNTQNITALREKPSGDLLGIQIACDHNPEFGSPILVAPGIWWVRLPLSSSLQAVNVYLLEDGMGLTLVDTGVKSAACREALDAALKHPAVAAHRLNKIIVTHFHPDHIGLVGELVRDGIELWTSRTTWLNCHLLSGNKQLFPSPPEVTFMQRAGLTGIELEAFRRHAVNRYGSMVAPPPDHYVPLVQYQLLAIGQRVWRVETSYGHAAEHISLWSEDCVISGDQILPSISSNLTVPYTESDVDVIGEWLRSCRDLKRSANNDALCLPGHQRPFYGIHNRLIQIEENIRKTLVRLKSIATQSTAAIDCVEQVYGRAITSDERRMMLPEIVGMLNHLYFHGALDRAVDDQGVFRYSALDTKQGRISGRKHGKEIPALHGSFEPDGISHYTPNNHAVQLDNARIEAITDSEEISSSLGIALRARTTRLAILAAICLTCGLVYWKWEMANSILQQTLQSYVQFDGTAAPIRPMEPNLVTVETTEIVLGNQVKMPRHFTGIVKPRRVSQVGFDRVGIVDQILVERGQQIDADTVLARLDTKLLLANLKAVQAQCNAAEARLSELVAGPREQTIKSAKEQVSSSKAELELARKSFGRAQRLIDIGAVSRQDLDNAQTESAAKEAALKSAENALDELLEGTRSEQVLAQRAQLLELEATREQIEVQLEESTLRAPFAATVSERFVEPGAVASPGTPAFRLVDTQSPEVWIGVPPEFLSTIQGSEKLELAISGRKYNASLKSILPELDTVTRTNTVIFSIPTSEFDDALFGQVARIELSRELEMTGFWVPLSALTEGDHGLWALLAIESTVDVEKFYLRRQDVEIVHVDSERAFVRGTFDSGTQVVSAGVQRLTPGQQVKLNSKTKTAEGSSVAMDALLSPGATK